MMKGFLTLLAGLLIAVPAFSVNWTVRALNPDVVSTAELNDTTDSGSLDASQCGRAAITFHEDTKGSGTTAAVTLRACPPGGAVASECTDTVLTDASTVTVNTTKTPVLKLVSITAAGANQRALVMAQCQEQFASFGGKAPGIEGINATDETLSWIGGLKTVPFPSAIDSGQWTDFYFSAEVGGDYPIGADTNNCTTPQQACKTIDKAREVCFEDANAFTRCNFDVYDDWTVANGGWEAAAGKGIGSLEDGDMTGDLTACPQKAPAALEQPCIWIRSSSYVDGEQATWNATGHTNNDDYMSFRYLTKRHGTLFENMHLIGDEHSSKGSTPFDSFDGTVLMGVGLTLSVGTSNINSGTANLSTCHDASVHANYGWTPMDYNANVHTSVGAAIGGQDACAQTLISNATVLGGKESSGGCTLAGLQMNPASTIPANAALQAELQALPKYDFIAQATLECNSLSTSTAVPTVVKFVPTTGLLDGNPGALSGDQIAAFVNTVLIVGNKSAYTASTQTRFTEFAPHTGTDLKVDFIKNVWKNSFDGNASNIAAPVGLGTYNSYCPANDPAGTAGSVCTGAAIPNVEVNVIGTIMEGNGDNNAAWMNHLRWFDDNAWKAGVETKLRWLDSPYIETGSTSWRALVFYDGWGVGSAEQYVLGQTDSAFTGSWNASAYTSRDVSDFFEFSATEEVAVASGLSDASSTTTVISLQGTPGFTVNAWIGCLAVNTTVSANQGSRRITANTADTITVDTAFMSAAANNDTIKVMCQANPNARYSCWDNGSNSGSCEGIMSAANAKYYRHTFDSRMPIPAWVAGRTLYGYDGYVAGGNAGRHSTAY